VGIGYFTSGPKEGIPLIELFGLDRMDASQNYYYADGVFDWFDSAAYKGGTIQATTGRIFFPYVEPFGRDLRQLLGDDDFAQEYCFDSLYTMTRTLAQQYADKNKFYLEGYYSSTVSGEISLGYSVSPGSVTVTAGGMPLIENVDYTVDYTMGTVRIVNESILSSGTPISVSSENNSFSMMTKTMAGAHVNYEIQPDFNIGATFMNLYEKPLTQKNNFGEEPTSNSIWGFDLNYRHEAPFITKLVDMLPGIDTKAPSNLSLSAEFAQFIPGLASTGSKEGSVTYVDDFEGVPQGQMPECWTSRWTGSASNKPKATEYAYSWEEDMTIRMIAGNGSSYGNGLSTVVLPGFDHPLNQLSLALDYYNGAYYGTLTVGYLVDTVYTPLRTLPYNFSVDYEMMRDTIDFSSVTAPGARMAIRLINPSMWEAIYLDNIEVFLTSQTGVPPVVSLNGPSNAVALNNITYTATLTSGDTTGVVYMWHSTLQDSMMTGPSVRLLYDTVGVDTLSVIATTPFGSDTAMRIVTVSWPDYLLPSVTLEGDPLCYTCDPATYIINALRSDSTIVHSALLDTTFAMTGSQFALHYTAGGVDTVTVTVANVYGSDTARWVVVVRDCQVVVTFPYVSVPAANDDSLYCWKIWQLDSICATSSDTHGRWFRQEDSLSWSGKWLSGFLLW
jgi:hypothetical protein